jgi:hypothetical protein
MDADGAAIVQSGFDGFQNGGAGCGGRDGFLAFFRPHDCTGVVLYGSMIWRWRREKTSPGLGQRRSMALPAMFRGVNDARERGYSFIRARASMVG